MKMSPEKCIERKLFTWSRFQSKHMVKHQLNSNWNSTGQQTYVLIHFVIKYDYEMSFAEIYVVYIYT